MDDFKKIGIGSIFQVNNIEFTDPFDWDILISSWGPSMTIRRFDHIVRRGEDLAGILREHKAARHVTQKDLFFVGLKPGDRVVSDGKKIKIQHLLGEARRIVSIFDRKFLRIKA